MIGLILLHSFIAYTVYAWIGIYSSPSAQATSAQTLMFRSYNLLLTALLRDVADTVGLLSSVKRRASTTSDHRVLIHTSTQRAPHISCICIQEP
jgi:hypothetical protein